VGSPGTEFEYRARFDLRVKSGLHVHRCVNDGQLIHMHTQQVEQPCGYAVSIVCVPPCTARIGCKVSSSSSSNYSGAATKRDLRCAVTGCSPTPKDYLCFVPTVSDGPEEDDGVELNIKINSEYS
jgi:hypothetical protein